MGERLILVPMGQLILLICHTFQGIRTLGKITYISRCLHMIYKTFVHLYKIYLHVTNPDESICAILTYHA